MISRIATMAVPAAATGLVLLLAAWGSLALPNERWLGRGAPSIFGTRIVNGNVAAKGQFPYQVALRVEYSGFCGGSLISKDWVLTAAHCTYNHRTWTVSLGVHDRLLPESGVQVISTSTAIWHEDFDLSVAKNDVAVLRISPAVLINAKVQPVRLPSQSQLSDLFVGRNAIVSGWGRTSSQSSISRYLRYAELTIISNKQCNETYDSEPIFDTTLCCQGENLKSTCNGDSGGPLVIQDSDGKPTQVGVVSFGSDSGCDRGFPHGYARLTSFLPWISKKTGIPISP